MMAASSRGLVEVVELLLSNGADVHLKDIKGHNALDWAIHFKHPAVEAVLRAHIAHLEAARSEAEAEEEVEGEGKGLGGDKVARKS